MYPLTLISLSIAVTLSSCRPDGAPLKSCRSMTPQHRGFPIPLIPQQTGASPYAFNAVWDSHMRMVRVSVSGDTVQGFLIQGRLAKSGPAIGRFVNITENPNAHYQNCSADKFDPESSVTHKSSQDKRNLVFYWEPPKDVDTTKNVTFYATLAQTKEMFWVMQESDSLNLNVLESTQMPTTQNGTKMTKSSVRTTSEGAKTTSPLYVSLLFVMLMFILQA